MTTALICLGGVFVIGNLVIGFCLFRLSGRISREEEEGVYGAAEGNLSKVSLQALEAEFQRDFA